MRVIRGPSVAIGAKFHSALSLASCLCAVGRKPIANLMHRHEKARRVGRFFQLLAQPQYVRVNRPRIGRGQITPDRFQNHIPCQRLFRILHKECQHSNSAAVSEICFPPRATVARSRFTVTFENVITYSSASPSGVTGIGSDRRPKDREAAGAAAEFIRQLPNLEDGSVLIFIPSPLRFLQTIYKRPGRVSHQPSGSDTISP